MAGRYVVVMVTLLLGYLHVTAAWGVRKKSGNSNCLTIESELLITKMKEEFEPGQPPRRPLLCAGKVAIKKCEGTCVSKVSPSVVHFPGFKKDCRCCRETALVSREVELTDCYDGSTLAVGESLKFKLREPSQCRCYDCAM